MNPRATPDVRDTIVALSAAAGPGARAIVRLSGPAAVDVAAARWSGPELIRARRGLVSGTFALGGVVAPLLADVYVWPAPRSYTGQDVVEIHTLSCLPLLDLLLAGLLAAG